jgi:hypothetical protein
MPHFYFHVRQDRDFFEDRRGGEFSDLLAAWNWAQADVEYMVREGGLSGPVEKCWMEICDVTGTLVASLPFVRVVN